MAAKTSAEPQKTVTDKKLFGQLAAKWQRETEPRAARDHGGERHDRP